MLSIINAVHGAIRGVAEAKGGNKDSSTEERKSENESTRDDKQNK